ncbi:multidrug effflux MFS transporter [Alteromonas lipolytica]|uniref:MFS transporter n=1 Tax=Alteromonas lipolytica TaxID=1856405 RepID=A0A1E8FAN0_9ALTE|nr:multidrug effflux MFS transporter [Alteromonas lipolytica]OFI32971.1 MFS transporter [Alteromonas lipolytica]GGF63752.1 MFS transporter [Alteromonas lipolytica]
MTQKTAHVKPALGLPEFIALMAVMTSLVALSIDAMLPALSAIGSAMGAADVHESHLIVSLFFAGMAVGQLFFGPYCDTRGRREAIILGLAIFVVGTIVCMLAEDMQTMLIGRVIQAFGVSGPRIASTAVIRDQFAGEAMARVMSFIMMVFILVPMLAPMVGQWVLNIASWIHIFTLFLVVAVMTGAWFWIRQPETLPASHRQAFSWMQFFRSSWFIVTHKPVIGPTLAMGCVFGGFLSYLSASQTIFQGFYGVGKMFSYIFALLAFSIGLASFINSKIVMRMGMYRVTQLGLVGSVAFAVIFLGIIEISGGLPPLAVTIASLFIGFFFVGLLFGNLNAIAMHPLGDMAGLGAAIIGSLSSIIAVLVATTVDSYLTDDLVPIGIGFVVFFSLSFIIIRFSMDKPENVG